jgi:TRAP-type C4-dicarboxylate transport system substrate-binding protein
MRSLGIFAIALALAMVGGSVQAKIVLKAGHVLTAQSDQGKGADFLAKRVKELTNGEIEIQVFPDGQLGKSDPDQLESLISGAQDIFITGMEWYKAWDNRFGILSTPFVFRDRAHLQAFTKDPLFAEMAKGLEDRGIKFLPRKFNWIRQMDRGVLSTKPVFVPDDLKGLTLRMYQSEMPIRSWQGLGATLQIMPWSDVYAGLATKTVDALTTVIGASYHNKHVEHAKYFTNIKEYFQPISPVISMKTWNKLSPAQRDALQQATDEGGDEYVRLSRAELTQSTKDAQEKYGVTFLSVPLKPWHDKMAPILAGFEKDGILPKGLVARVKAIK